MEKSYEQGKQDGLALYGRVCSQYSNCDGCMVEQLKGDSISCQEFMARFPQKMVSLLTDMSNKEYTFYNEFVTRFPNCNLSLDDISDTLCRKLVFEGYVACEGGDCRKCWSEGYVADITMADDEDEDSNIDE